MNCKTEFFAPHRWLNKLSLVGCNQCCILVQGCLMFCFREDSFFLEFYTCKWDSVKVLSLTGFEINFLANQLYSSVSNNVCLNSADKCDKCMNRLVSISWWLVKKKYWWFNNALLHFPFNFHYAWVENSWSTPLQNVVCLDSSYCRLLNTFFNFLLKALSFFFTPAPGALHSVWNGTSSLLFCLIFHFLFTNFRPWPFSEKAIQESLHLISIINGWTLRSRSKRKMKQTLKRARWQRYNF